jgi:hypothetical protein
MPPPEPPQPSASATRAQGGAEIEVHALLLCRKVVTAPGGNVSLEDVLEILPVDALPGDVGPLSFVAFVRHLPAGPGRGAFVVEAAGDTPRVVARAPLEVNVPEGYRGRQVAVQVRLPSLPLTRGGWYQVAFEWEGTRLATNRFAVGARSKPPA